MHVSLHVSLINKSSISDYQGSLVVLYNAQHDGYTQLHLLENIIVKQPCFVSVKGGRLSYMIDKIEIHTNSTNQIRNLELFLPIGVKSQNDQTTLTW